MYTDDIDLIRSFLNWISLWIPQGELDPWPRRRRLIERVDHYLLVGVLICISGMKLGSVYKFRWMNLHFLYCTELPSNHDYKVTWFLIHMGDAAATAVMVTLPQSLNEPCRNVSCVGALFDDQSRRHGARFTMKGVRTGSNGLFS